MLIPQAGWKGDQNCLRMMVGKGVVGKFKQVCRRRTGINLFRAGAINATKLFNKSTELKQNKIQGNTKGCRGGGIDVGIGENLNSICNRVRVQPLFALEKCEEKLHLASALWTKGDEIQSCLVLNIGGLTLSEDGKLAYSCLQLPLDPVEDGNLLSITLLHWKLWFMYLSGNKSFLQIRIQRALKNSVFTEKYRNSTCNGT